MLVKLRCTVTFLTELEVNVAKEKFPFLTTYFDKTIKEQDGKISIILQSLVSLFFISELILELTKALEKVVSTKDVSFHITPSTLLEN